MSMLISVLAAPIIYDNLRCQLICNTFNNASITKSNASYILQHRKPVERRITASRQYSLESRSLNSAPIDCCQDNLLVLRKPPTDIMSPLIHLSLPWVDCVYAFLDLFCMGTADPAPFILSLQQLPL